MKSIPSSTAIDITTREASKSASMLRTYSSRIVVPVVEDVRRTDLVAEPGGVRMAEHDDAVLTHPLAPCPEVRPGSPLRGLPPVRRPRRASRGPPGSGPDTPPRRSRDISPRGDGRIHSPSGVGMTGSPGRSGGSTDSSICQLKISPEHSVMNIGS